MAQTERPSAPAAGAAHKPCVIPGNALQLDLGDADTALLVTSGPFLSISPDPPCAPMQAHTPNLASYPVRSPYPTPASPAIVDDDDEYDETADEERDEHKAPPRVRFRSRVRIRGLRRSRARSHDSSDSGSRSSTVSVPLNMHSGRGVLGLKISTVASRTPTIPRISSAEYHENSPLLSPRPPRPPGARRTLPAMRAQQIREESLAHENDEEWKALNASWWRPFIETTFCSCCAEDEDEHD
ncbi:hypothetical protein K488DRAFT_83250 [Vararia minispora EC-137]|uniref:Uncharacterized protein n=1 Tax=Vararia minispora EC-137 TaxID=1314806 RepID=A0ACB8QTR9_9AGAM|nr:hypothetical protein K488DRAFT_83250 [Vararia minispora EC-137]